MPKPLKAASRRLRRGEPAPTEPKRLRRVKPPKPMSDDITWSEFWATYLTDTWCEGPTWGPWLACTKAIFGEPLTADELALFQQHTGRTEAPTRQASEAWLGIGRRGGKDWIAAAIVVYLACFREHGLKLGEKGRVMLLAVDQDQASEVFGFIEGLITGIEPCARMVTSRTRRTIDLSNGVQILVKPADRRRVRGRKLLAVVLDEIAQWWSEEVNANRDVEVLRALRPSFLGVKGALLIAISSLFAKRGALYECFKKHWGVNGDRILFWKAKTIKMHPSTDPEFVEFLAEQERLDPVAFASEYGDSFRDDLQTFISPEQVEALVMRGRAWLAYEPGMRHFAFLDPAGGTGGDSATLGIGRYAIDKVFLCRLVEWRPPFSPVAVARELVDVLREYRLSDVRGDRFSGGTWPDLIREAAKAAGTSVTYQAEERSKSDIYHEALPLLTSGRAELLDHDRLVNQLIGLERRTSNQGKEIIGHPARSGAVDDVANAALGCLTLAAKAGMSPSAVVVASVPRRQAPVMGQETGKNARHLGGDMFVAPNGETFKDPRGL